MAHGYLGEGYGTHGEIDPNRGDERDRGRYEHSNRNWRAREDWRDRSRDRGMMFGSRESDEWRDRSWGDEERWSNRNWRRERWPEDRWPEQRSRAASYNREAEDWSGQHRYSANPEDHYRSWRDRHMSELDRDYAEYCREREEQFHRDFDEWRRRRAGTPQPLRTGMAQTGLSHDPTGMTEAASETAPAAPAEPDPTATATLGTNAAPQGRGRR